MESPRSHAGSHRLTLCVMFLFTNPTKEEEEETMTMTYEISWMYTIIICEHTCTILTILGESLKNVFTTKKEPQKASGILHPVDFHIAHVVDLGCGIIIQALSFFHKGNSKFTSLGVLMNYS